MPCAESERKTERKPMTEVLGEYTRDTAFWIVRQLAHAGIEAEPRREDTTYTVAIRKEDRARAERIV